MVELCIRMTMLRLDKDLEDCFKKGKSKVSFGKNIYTKMHEYKAMKITKDTQLCC